MHLPDSIIPRRALIDVYDESVRSAASPPTPVERTDTFILYADNSKKGAPSLPPYEFIASGLGELLTANSKESLDGAIKIITDNRYPSHFWNNVLVRLSDNPFRLAQALVIMSYYNPYVFRVIPDIYKTKKTFLACGMTFDSHYLATLNALYDAGLRTPRDELIARFKFYILGEMADALEEKNKRGEYPVSKEDWAAFAKQDINTKVVKEDFVLTMERVFIGQGLSEIDILFYAGLMICLTSEECNEEKVFEDQHPEDPDAMYKFWVEKHKTP